MFNFKSWSESDGETTCSIVSGDVLYVLYFSSIDFCFSLNSYIVHPSSGGLIRRDYHIVGGPFNWGPTGTIMYNGAN